VLEQADARVAVLEAENAAGTASVRAELVRHPDHMRGRKRIDTAVLGPQTTDALAEHVHRYRSATQIGATDAFQYGG
jgi:hypothetical protein